MNVGRIPLCGQFNVLYADVIADIAQWRDEPGHENEFIRIYINVNPSSTNPNLQIITKPISVVLQYNRNRIS